MSALEREGAIRPPRDGRFLRPQASGSRVSTSPQRTIDIPIVVNAWGAAAGGTAPHFRLLVDGVMIGEAWVGATSSTPYTFTARVDPDQAHRISIWYDNDGMVNGVDRNLFVASIVVDGQEIASTDPRVTYDKGAVDGKDVVAGQVGLYWGGLLSFGLGEEMFGGPLVRPPPKPEEAITRPIPITVEAARGASVTGPVRFQVLVDGKLAGEAEATSTTAERFTFSITIDPSIAHTVQILPVGGAQAGDLALGAVTVNGQPFAAPAPAGDGVATLAVATPVFQGTASEAAAPQGDAFYVAKNGNDSWSGRLAEPNADGTDGPFASLERAGGHARQHHQDHLRPRGRLQPDERAWPRCCGQRRPHPGLSGRAGGPQRRRAGHRLHLRGQRRLVGAPVRGAGTGRHRRRRALPSGLQGWPTTRRTRPPAGSSRTRAPLAPARTRCATTRAMSRPPIWCRAAGSRSSTPNGSRTRS